MTTQNPAIDAIDRLVAHFGALKPDSTITAEFITEHSQLIEQVRTYAQGLLTESRHSEDGYKALQVAHAELIQKHAKLQGLS